MRHAPLAQCHAGCMTEPHCQRMFHTLHFREYDPTAGFAGYTFYGFLALQFLRLGYWYSYGYQSIWKTLATISSRSFVSQFAT